MLLENMVMFNKVANEKSISKVATANHISQPALSQQMQRLEEEFGMKLLNRSNRGIELTEAGRIMQKYAVQFEKIYQNLREEIDNLKESQLTFRIAATPVVCNYALPCNLYKMNKQFPACAFSLKDEPSREIVVQVQNGQVDMGFIVGQCETDTLIQVPAFSDKIYLIADISANVPEIKSVQDIGKLPLVMLNGDFSSHRLVCNYLKKMGCAEESLNVSCYLNSTEAIKSAVSAGLGMAFLPYMAVKKELYMQEFKIVEIPGFDLSYDIYSIYRADGEERGSTINEIIKYLVTTVQKNIC